MGFIVYACGSNGKFQLGDSTDVDRDVPVPVFETDYEVKKVVCGGNHTLLLLKNGDLFTAGDNSRGQCGLTGVEDVHSFTQVPGKWSNCSAGFEFSVLVSADNEIYSCGVGLKGELGQGDKITQSSLSKVDLNITRMIADLGSCLDHTVLLLENGDLYVWGNSRNGKLIETTDNKIWQPRLVQLPNFKVSKVQVGRDFTLLSDDWHKVKFYGKDRYEIEENIPSDFDEFKTMWSSVHFRKGGNIVSVGNNSHNQLLANCPESHLDDFSLGSEHGLILSSNKVYSWGWGEHGNCGRKMNKSTSFKLSLLFESNRRVMQIFGGCATSWIITSS